MAFVEASEFLGRREGFVFKLGDQGLGYYEEQRPLLKELSFGGLAVHVEVDATPSGYTGLRIWPSAQRLGLSTS